METKKLISILQMVMPAVEKNSTIAQQDHFVFHNGNVSTYNGKLFFSHPVDTDIECSVSASDLMQTLQTIDSEQIALSVENSLLKIDSDDVNAELSTEVYEESVLNAVKALKIADLKWDDAEEVPKYFIEGIKMCRFSVSKDASHPLNISNLHVIDDVVESGDGYRCTEYIMDKKMEEMLIPASSANVLANYTPELYILQGGWAHFIDHEEVIFSVRVGQGDFPDIGKVVGHATKNIVKVVLPDKLKDLLGKFSTLSSGDLDIYKFIEIDIKDGKMKASTSKETLKIEKSLDVAGDLDISFIISPVFLASIMDKTNEVWISAETKHAVFQLDSFTHVVTLPEK